MNTLNKHNAKLRSTIASHQLSFQYSFTKESDRNVTTFRYLPPFFTFNKLQAFKKLTGQTLTPEQKKVWQSILRSNKKSIISCLKNVTYSKNLRIIIDNSLDIFLNLSANSEYSSYLQRLCVIKEPCHLKIAFDIVRQINDPKIQQEFIFTFIKLNSYLNLIKDAKNNKEYKAINKVFKFLVDYSNNSQCIVDILNTNYKSLKIEDIIISDILVLKILSNLEYRQDVLPLLSELILPNMESPKLKEELDKIQITTPKHKILIKISSSSDEYHNFCYAVDLSLLEN